jgi:molybdopterin molybdotransferase
MAKGVGGADLLVTTGGASVGEHDLIRSGLTPDGLTLDFWKIAMRPGKPLIFGDYAGVPMLGLPGNPVSTIVCATIFLRPAIDALLGVTDAPSAPRFLPLAVDLGPNDRRQDYLRSEIVMDAQGRPAARPFPKQDSSMLSLLAKSDCLVIRPALAPAAAAGTLIEILEFTTPFPTF